MSTIKVGIQIWSFLINVKVNGNSCEVAVEACDIRGTDYRAYGGVENLRVEINSSNDLIYYLQDLAEFAVKKYILEGLTKDKQEVF